LTASLVATSKGAHEAVARRAERGLRRLCLRGRFKASRKSGNDDYDNFSLPTGSGFTENTLELSARRFVTNVKLGRSGPQCFSCDEMKCQSGLG
jgi:hypothetical protein